MRYTNVHGAEGWQKAISYGISSRSLKVHHHYSVHENNPTPNLSVTLLGRGSATLLRVVGNSGRYRRAMMVDGTVQLRNSILFRPPRPEVFVIWKKIRPLTVEGLPA